ncbi:hypothetical protein LMH87_010251 [Akanthomyces muscarius]|uniref:Ankyrin repeat protein n=1 Tax=Akanthomyces muscarius TaxID=2231603 RepID=A0A9W8ULS8_AKAMU|nr:hypothetical protein LMH87_010251 [Akanthomyces muscarius]KAJ4153778.1 hypothetical protein LMH87_010251 [Akanthomyces muscarius]
MDALATNIARLADSCAADIRAAVVAETNGGQNLPHLTSACSALEALQRSAVQLRGSLAAATVSEALRMSVMQSLGACHTHAALLFKQVARLDADNAIKTREDFWTVLGAFVGAHVKLFACYADLLATTDGQDERLNAAASQEVVHQAAHAVRLAINAPDIFADEPSHAASLPYSVRDVEAPPPYESNPAPPPASGILRRASHDSEAAGSSSARSRAWAKIASPVKAIRGHMGAGVVLPFVDELCAAAAGGQAKQVEALVAQGACVDGISSHNDTALGLAAAHNHIDVARTLLQAGAQATFHSPHRMPPVFVAAAAGHRDLALLLLERGASVTAKDMRGQPFLIQLVDEGDHAAMQFLLQHGANANAKDITGRTPIVHAVATNDVSMATILLAFGADPNARDLAGRPLLVQAVQNQNGALVRFLLDSGADSNSRDMTGASVLAVACQKHVKTSETVQLLLRRGARPDSTTVTGVTVLADALGRHRVDLARVLLEHGADAGATEVTGQPLVITVVRSRKVVLEDKMELLGMMLKRGASVQARDFVTRETAVEVARKVECKKVVKLLESYENAE